MPSLPEQGIRRGVRPDGTWEVWRDGDPMNALYGLNRLQALLIVAVLRIIQWNGGRSC